VRTLILGVSKSKNNSFEKRKKKRNIWIVVYQYELSIPTPAPATDAELGFCCCLLGTSAASETGRLRGSGAFPAMSLRPSERAEVRRNRYKVAVDAEEGRRRREDNMVEIRKSRREESLLKKRREGLQPQVPVPASGGDKKVRI
jgi:hypothetical protein